MSNLTNSAGAITLGGVCFTADGVYEGPLTSPTTAAPRKRIEHLRLRYGFQVRNPLLLALFGLVLVGVGVIPLVHAAVWLIRGGIFLGLEMLLLVPLVLGLMALYQAFRRGYVLEVETTVGLRSFEFSKGVNPSEVETFLAQAESAFGYSIERPHPQP